MLTASLQFFILDALAGKCVLEKCSPPGYAIIGLGGQRYGPMIAVELIDSMIGGGLLSMSKQITKLGMLALQPSDLSVPR